jgi:hypothetical protein
MGVLRRPRPADGAARVRQTGEENFHLTLSQDLRRGDTPDDRWGAGLRPCEAEVQSARRSRE